MDFKRFFRSSAFVLVAVLIILGLAACTKSASSGIPEDTEAAGEFPVPEYESMGPFESTPTQAPAVVAPEVAEATIVVATEVPPPTALPAATEVPLVLPEPTHGSLPATYTLRKGEFPYCIARRYDVNPGELLTINGLGTNTLVQPGTTLKIPQTGNSFNAPRALLSHPTTYSVASGDTFYSIACKFGDVGPDLIALANNMSVDDSLTAGQTLQIP